MKAPMDPSGRREGLGGLVSGSFFLMTYVAEKVLIID